MSFDNDYPNRKDRRKPYFRSGKYSHSCRPNGGCPWCEGNRLFSYEKELLRAEQSLLYFDEDAYYDQDSEEISRDGES